MAILLGFIPWKTLFSVEFRNLFLEYLTSPSLGFIGLIALSIFLIFGVSKTDYRFRFGAIVICSVLTICFVFCLFFCLLTSGIKWTDGSIYNNGSEYLIVEEFDNFVTNSVVEPRVIHTTSPYSAIRKIEIRKDANNDLFGGDSLVYRGKVWHKKTK
jgi:hypothetical protein